MAEQTLIDPEDHELPSWREVFLYFLMLGFVNVGGPKLTWHWWRLVRWLGVSCTQ